LPIKNQRNTNIDGAGPSRWTGSDVNQAANLTETQRAHNESERRRKQIIREKETQAKRIKRLNGDSQRIAKKRSREKSATKICIKRDGMLTLKLIPVSGS
jgi:hypothetical protein